MMKAKFASVPMKRPEGTLDLEMEVHVLEDESKLRLYIIEDTEYLLDELRKSIIDTEKTLEALKEEYIKLRESKENIESVEDERLVDFCNEIYESRKYPRHIMVTDY